MSNYYKGLKIILDNDFSFTSRPEEKWTILDEYDIKEIHLQYEHKTCGCCPGDKEIIKLKMRDLFDFIDAGGKEQLIENNNCYTKLKQENKVLKKKLKQYEEVIGKLT